MSSDDEAEELNTGVSLDSYEEDDDEYDDYEIFNSSTNVSHPLFITNILNALEDDDDTSSDVRDEYGIYESNTNKSVWFAIEHSDLQVIQERMVEWST